MARFLTMAAAMIALIAAGAGPAVAFSPPNYDTSAYCRKVAPNSYSLELGCVDMEREAQSWLESTDIPSDVWLHCSDLMSQTMSTSYSLLKGCIEMESDAKRKLGRPR